MVSVLTPAEILIAARRLVGARPHLTAVAGIVHHEDLWQLCRDELTGVEIGSWGGTSPPQWSENRQACKARDACREPLTMTSGVTHEAMCIQADPSSGGAWEPWSAARRKQ